MCRPRGGEGGNVVALYPVAGLDTPIELPCPLIIRLMPTWQTNQRPGGLRRTPPYWVQHETGNERPGTGAQNHYAYMAGGAMARDNAGNLYSQTLGYHFSTDGGRKGVDEPGVIWQMVPVNEPTWQAADGDGPGNLNGISNEMCVNVDGDEARARRNSIALAAGVMGALGAGIDQIRSHWDFNFANSPAHRHHCPDHMLDDGFWPTGFRAGVQAIWDAKAPREVAEFARAVFPAWWSDEALFDGEDREHGGAVWHAVSATYTALKDVRCTAWAGPDAPNTRSPVRKGEKVRGYYRVRASDGKWYVVTRGGSRLRASSLSPFISVDERKAA